MKVTDKLARHHRVPSLRRRILIRLLVCLVVCLPLVLVEGVVRLCVPDPGSVLEDPFVSFGNLRPLFVPDASGTLFEIAPERTHYFCPQQFKAAKGANTFRIFCVGGSTVQGRPYSVETSFSTWLKLNLEVLCPGKDIEMVNCGGISYASYRLIPIMKELLAYEPDLLILCTGQNEFLEARTYGRIKRVPRPLIGLHQTLLHARTYQLANHWLGSRRNRTQATPAFPAEVQPKLDMKAGLSTYHRDEAMRDHIMAEFARNLEGLLDMAEHANVPLILMNPVSNLKDCPPFKSEFSTASSPARALWEQMCQLEKEDPWRRLARLEKAVTLDDQHAGILYLLGTYYMKAGRVSEARACFVAAKEHDICPLRMLEPMHKAIKEAAARHGLPLVDIRELIEQKSEHRLPGDEWLLDHVHPNINGHQLIADALTEVMVAEQWVKASAAWREVRETLWQAHLMSLDQGYYQTGFEHLMMLKTWSRQRTIAF
ncbi:MAG: SGNH/GDSL hydrolase family protein [Planctomycetes bacterium]|nr:SGNH/GDSL hydrolase family protein [Planctomycetota bacterium]